jgi:hypothetical protein
MNLIQAADNNLYEQAITRAAADPPAAAKKTGIPMEPPSSQAVYSILPGESKNLIFVIPHLNVTIQPVS